jgi:hypothetical protein
MSEVKVNKISPRTNCGTVTVGDSGDSVSVSAGVPVTVNGDLKSNALKATDGGSIISQCGTTITLGASGDTVSLASGATQSGFGRTGTVDWDTTAKTGSFTAVSGNGYFVNTTSGSITATLPATPSAGDIVSFKDYANTFDTNKLVLDRNGSNIDGVANNFEVTAEGQSITLVYIDATRGWVPTDAAKASDFSQQATFITATGGTITECGDFKIHTFTSPGTFTVTTLGNQPTVPAGGPTNVDYLVVAGGAGGGCGGGGGAGGGGAGGHRTSFPSPSCNAGAFPVTATAFPITVGAGGVGAPNYGTPAPNGGNSIFSTITSAGGGGGGGHPHAPEPTNHLGKDGGSGGASSWGGNGSGGGSGNTPPVSPPQGNNGGNGGGCGYYHPTGHQGGGGGGATAAGGSYSPGSGGAPGGAGTANSITGSPVTRAGGGGGGTANTFNGSNFSGGSGGSGGGGTGSVRPGGPGNPGGAAGTSGTANTGGGGGGRASGPDDGGTGATTHNGGSGIVIIRYKFQ